PEDSGMSQIIKTTQGAVATTPDRPETVGQVPVVLVPQIRTAGNLHLRWGEWFGITLFSVAAMALASEGVMLAAATAWFGDPSRALLPLPALIVTFFVAALVMRLSDDNAALQPLSRSVLVLGIISTALVLIRLYVFPTLPGNDWSWLASFSNLASLTAEQPHAELGMMLVSAITWLIGERLARNAGDYEARRGAFIGFFILLVVAIILGVGAVRGTNLLATRLALFLPLYTFFGLLMMAQVRLAEVRSHMGRGGVEAHRALRVWRVMTGGLVLAAVALVLGLTANATAASTSPPVMTRHTRKAR